MTHRTTPERIEGINKLDVGRKTTLSSIMFLSICNDKVFLCDYHIRHNRGEKKMLIKPDLPVPTVPLWKRINEKIHFAFAGADIVHGEADSAAVLHRKALAISLATVLTFGAITVPPIIQ